MENEPCDSVVILRLLQVKTESLIDSGNLSASGYLISSVGKLTEELALAVVLILYLSEYLLYKILKSGESGRRGQNEELL